MPEAGMGDFLNFPIESDGRGVERGDSPAWLEVFSGNGIDESGGDPAAAAVAAIVNCEGDFAVMELPCEAGTGHALADDMPWWGMGCHRGSGLGTGSVLFGQEGEEIFVGIGLCGIIILGVAEEIFVEVFGEDFLVRLGKAVPDGDIQGAGDLHHHLQGEPAPGDGAGELLVGELFRRGFDEIVIPQSPAGDQRFEGLGAKVLFRCVHGWEGVVRWERGWGQCRLSARRMA